MDAALPARKTTRAAQPMHNMRSMQRRLYPVHMLLIPSNDVARGWWGSRKMVECRPKCAGLVECLDHFGADMAPASRRFSLRDQSHSCAARTVVELRYRGFDRSCIIYGSSSSLQFWDSLILVTLRSLPDPSTMNNRSQCRRYRHVSHLILRLHLSSRRLVCASSVVAMPFAMG